MTISAKIKNTKEENVITVSTDNRASTISIPGKEVGRGSAVNGGELLFLSLATCFCNDLYREALRRNMDIASVEVEVAGQFGKEGEPATDIRYEVKVMAPECTEEAIRALIQHVDGVAEIHNTLRRGVSVSLNMIHHFSPEG